MVQTAPSPTHMIDYPSSDGLPIAQREAAARQAADERIAELEARLRDAGEAL